MGRSRLWHLPEVRIDACHGLLDLCGGDLGIALCHPQIAVPELSGDDVQFRSALG
ncbi:MAG: hypothetical protein ACRD3O_08510 [Terriglobia bacterium]